MVVNWGEGGESDGEWIQYDGNSEQGALLNNAIKDEKWCVVGLC